MPCCRTKSQLQKRLRHSLHLGVVTGLLFGSRCLWGESKPGEKTSVVPTSTVATAPAAASPDSAANAPFAGAGDPTADYLSISPKVMRYAAVLIRRFDQDGDGRLQKTEWQNLQGHPEQIDTNHDGEIQQSEIAAWIAEYSRRKRIGLPAITPSDSSDPAANQLRNSVEVLGQDPGTETKDALAGARRRDSKFFVPDNRLPMGLPEWFHTKDLDGDGQLSPSEFSPAGIAAELIEFGEYDANGDGILTAKECVRKSSSSKP